jgi:hypothetical protein
MPRSYRSRRRVIKAISPQPPAAAHSRLPRADTQPGPGADWGRGARSERTQEDAMSEHTSPVPPEPGSEAGEVFPPEPGAEAGEAFPPEPGNEAGEVLPPEPGSGRTEVLPPEPDEPDEPDGPGSPLPPE